MAAFDEAWWDLRTMRNGVIDTHGMPLEGTPQLSWVRWRLIDDLLQRYYLDIGLEPVFGHLGVELYNIGLASPTCHRAPRYFGRLSGPGVHSEDDASSLELTIQPTMAWANIGTGHESDHEAVWSSWSDYRTAAIRTLGLTGAGVKGHEGCFHRRGKALTPLMYRVALLLRTDAGYDLSPEGERMLTVTPDGTGLRDHRVFVDLISSAGDTLPSGPPRYLGVSTQNGDWIALRTDGVILTTAGPVDAGGLWRSGADPEAIAAAVTTMLATG